MQETNEKIKRLIEDKQYMKKLLSLGSVEEMAKELEKEDINLSLEDLKKLYTLAKKIESGELTDAELEEVAGGQRHACDIDNLELRRHCEQENIDEFGIDDGPGPKRCLK